MAVGSGTGNTISFSTIRDFYGDTNPVSISEFNRNTSNDTLVDATFAGASTATVGTSSQTVDDFAVTVTEVDGSLVELTTSGSNQANAPFPINASAASFTLLNTTSFVSVTILGQGNCTFSINGSQIGSVNVDNNATNFTIKGPQFNTGDRASASVSTVFSAGDVFTLSCGTNAGQNARTNTSTHGVRAVEHDITFQNNNSTGDTYNLTSNSTGGSSKTAYAAGDSFLAQNNGSSNQFLLAYDNVTGAGPGTAGDINVTETSAFTGTLGSIISRVNTSVSNSSGGGTISDTYTVLASDSVLILGGGGQNQQSGADGDGIDLVGSWSTSGIINISPVASGQSKFYRGPAYQSGDSSNLTFSGSISAGTFTITSSVGSAGGGVSVSTRRRAEQFTTVFTNSSGSKSYTLGSSSTGGAVTLAAGATRNAQTTSSSGSSWAVHFDTGSGDCNVGIPTTIGSGNPVNLDLFNTVTTPIG